MRGLTARNSAIALAGFLGAALVVLTQAPASILARQVASRSLGRAELAAPAGTLWSGTADIVLSTGEADAAARTRIPGRAAWHISPWRLLTGTLDATLADPAVLEGPVELRLDLHGNATVDAGRLRLPASVLEGLGAPWNTIRPGGDLQLEWDTLHAQAGEVHGGIRGEWIDASSGLSPIVPFGHYRLQLDGVYDGAQVQLDTITGPMEMTGNGTIAGGKRLQFHGTARVQPGTDPAVATQLSGLISLLGPRDGEGAILNFGR